MTDTPRQPQEIELSTKPEPDPTAGDRRREIFDKAKEKIDRAFDEAKEELAEFAEEAREEFQELKEKAPEWVKDARRKVADFLEPDEPAPPESDPPKAE